MRSGPAERVRDREGVGVAAGVGVPLSSLALGLSICDGELRWEKELHQRRSQYSEVRFFFGGDTVHHHLPPLMPQIENFLLEVHFRYFHLVLDDYDQYYLKLSMVLLGLAGLSWSVDEKSLSDAFSSFGEVTEVKIIYDKDSGRSRGFGFVQYLKEDDALSAKDAMDGKALLGRPLRITVAVDKARGGPVVVPRLSNMANGAGNDA
ncbi:hypothetical protein F8388_015528 [Cannabis sativa]|uniref:RRM domain-containing protein n=1 Tax=Cannabis sativa TaxID=3483 RepID=A0A7J6GK38_CANSA|nr:hypothetical protein F8388_015528 [Cannabis sativa]